MGLIQLPDSAVLAFGGNALKEGGENGNTFEAQNRAMQKAAEIIACIYERINKLAVVHGNGPQVGWAMQRAELAMKLNTELHPLVLSLAGAGTQGCIGTNMVRQVVNEDESLNGKVVELGTQVLVDPNDPAFNDPSKPVGGFMTKEEAEKMERECDWTTQKREDGEKGKPYRRVVSSPEPKEIMEIDIIKFLTDLGIITICAGGGGIPTIKNKEGELEWIDGVIDKDLAAQVLAEVLNFKMLAIFTAEAGIFNPDDFKRKQSGDTSVKPIPEIKVSDLKQMEELLPSGSMGPKAIALRRFVEKTGNFSWVGPLENGLTALTEGRGTTVVPD